MILLGLIAVCLMWLGLSALMDKKKAFNNDYEVAMFASLIFMLIFVLISVVSIFWARYAHYEDFADYLRTEKNIEVYEERKSDLTTKFSDILSTQYVKHESKLFDQMSPEDIKILLVKYPQIKANTTLMDLSNKILELNDKVYDEQIYLNKIAYRINIRYIKPLVFGFTLPDVPNYIIQLEETK
jgi:hypothetical protein